MEVGTWAKHMYLFSSKTPTRRKAMPKLVYNLMKDGDIRKRLGEVGLPTQGDRQVSGADKTEGQADEWGYQLRGYQPTQCQAGE